MLPVIHVPTQPLGVAIACAQCLNLGAFSNEVGSPMPYSRFAAAALAKTKGEATVPSRVGMGIIYAPALAVAAAAYATCPAAAASDVVAGANGREGLVAAMLVAHFGKRCAEVAFLHAYSGSVALATAGAIGGYYALVTALVVASQWSVPSYAAPPQIGLTLFVIGSAGNLYHHWLLARSRRGGGDAAEKYVVPTGGLFDRCTMPHYLFEILAWAGIAATSAHLHAWLAAAGMASYLAGRSVATTRWYKAKFGGLWPADRTHLVPFLF